MKIKDEKGGEVNCTITKGEEKAEYWQIQRRDELNCTMIKKEKRWGQCGIRGRGQRSHAVAKREREGENGGATRGWTAGTSVEFWVQFLPLRYLRKARFRRLGINVQTFAIQR